MLAKIPLLGSCKRQVFRSLLLSILFYLGACQNISNYFSAPENAPAPGEMAARLFKAIDTDDLAQLDALIHSGIQADTPDADGYTALMFAATLGKIGALETLLNNQASLEARTPEGYTALMLAAENGQTESAKWLIAHGASVSQFDDWGVNALLRAAYAGNPEIVETLLKHKADPNQCDIHMNCPLLWATMSNCSSCVQALLKYGANPAAINNLGLNAAMIAEKHGYEEIRKQLP